MKLKEKPWAGDGMYGQAFKMRLGYSLLNPMKPFIKLNGWKFWVDSISVSSFGIGGGAVSL